jgi:ABC-type sugar transport system ATPase subunit
MDMEDKAIRLKLEAVGKSFPGVNALEGIDLEIREGEIHAIVGENGAGKSTLMNILSGVYQPDRGALLLDGKPMKFKDTRDAQDLGIAMIHQELSLAPHLSVAENIFIGRLPRNRKGFLDLKGLAAAASAILDRLEVCDFKPESIVYELSTSQMQFVEIAKALSLNASILIMDEPTSSLTTSETNTLLGLMRNLATAGVSILFISHRIDEVLSSADRITVLRDGKLVSTRPRMEFDSEQLLSCMVGREFNKSFHREYKVFDPGDPAILQVKGLRCGQKVRDVSFDIHRGEILALTGLVGAGRTETVEAIFGARARTGGAILLDGVPIAPRHPADAVRLGLGLVPEGRKIQGIFPELSVEENMTITRLPALCRALFFRRKDRRVEAEKYRVDLNVKTPSLEQKIKYLSGGNQQKAIFSRWLMNGPRVLFLDEPTHGIDVGAKEEIYKLINGLAESGVAIILISSELPEVLCLADRILVMKEGAIASELSHSEATQERIMHYAVTRKSCA